MSSAAVSTGLRRRRDAILAGRRTWGLLVALCLLALTIRLLYWLVLTPHQPLTSDAGQYSFLASNLAHGKGYVDKYPQLSLHQTAFRPPLYPAILSLFYVLFGVHPGLARLLNVLVGTGVVGLTHVVVRRYLSTAAAVGAAVAVAVSPNLVANDTFALNEPLALGLILTMAWALLERRWIVGGLLTGALVLTRPSAQFLLLALAVWILVFADWRRLLLFGAMVGLVVLPWVVRNWVQVGSPVLVTSNGYNWAALYSPPAQKVGRFVDPVENSYFDFMRLDQFDEKRWDRHLQKIGQKNLTHHPVLLWRVTSRNFVAFFEFKPSINRFAEQADGRNMTMRNATLWLFYLTFAAGLAGLWMGRKNRLVQLLVLMSGYFALASLIFVAPPRLRAPVDLTLCVGAGVVIDSIWHRWHGRHEGRSHGELLRQGSEPDQRVTSDAHGALTP